MRRRKGSRFKYNGGAGALLCSGCSVIIKTGKDFTQDEWKAIRGEKKIRPQYCDRCKLLKFKYIDKNFLVYRDALEDGETLPFPEVEPVLPGFKDGTYIFRPSKNRHLTYVVIDGRWYLERDGEAYDPWELQYFSHKPTPREYQELMKYEYALSPLWKRYVSSYRFYFEILKMKRNWRLEDSTRRKCNKDDNN